MLLEIFVLLLTNTQIQLTILSTAQATQNWQFYIKFCQSHYEAQIWFVLEYLSVRIPILNGT